MTNALSHERMTPLNSIINGCELIESWTKKEESKIELNVSKKHSKSLEDSVELKFSRINEP